MMTFRHHNMWVPSCLLWFAVFCACVETQEEEGPIVTTTYGSVKGRRLSGDIGILAGIETTTVDEFLGIPYAKPPVGERRFQRPCEPDSWDGIRDATEYAAVCPQTSELVELMTQDESCLFLNIYSPFESQYPAKRYPVMVFIHGGSYNYGSGNRYNGTALAQQGVVLVSINYRLGVLGFLSTGDADMPGNYGLLDQVQALKWVKDNIGNFRGDPDVVTIFGSSAGGASVGLMMISPLAKGLFHRAIAQSGTSNAMWATHETNSHLRTDVTALASAHGCPTEPFKDLLDCLRKLDWKSLSIVDVCRVIKCTEVDPPLKPAVDGYVFTKSPRKQMETLDFHTVPYMTGTVRTEFGEYFSTNYTQSMMWKEVDSFLDNTYGSLATKTIMHEYTNWTKPHLALRNNSLFAARNYDRAGVLSDIGLIAPTAEMASHLATKPGMKVFLYHFDNPISYHSVELIYVFGTPFIGGYVDEMGILNATTVNNYVNREKSRLFMRLWVNFAKYGHPTAMATSGHPSAWDQVQPVTMDYMFIKATDTNTTLSMRSHLFGPQVALWNIFIPNLMANSGKDKGENHVLGFRDSKTWIFFGFTVGLLCVVAFLLCLIVWGNRKSSRYSQLLRGSSGTSYSVNL